MEHNRNCDTPNRSNVMNRMDTKPNMDTQSSYPSQDRMRVKLPPQYFGLEAQPCANSNCAFYGTLEFDFFCSKCYNAKLQHNKDDKKSPIASKVETLITNDTILPEVTRQQRSINNTEAQSR